MIHINNYYVFALAMCSTELNTLQIFTSPHTSYMKWSHFTDKKTETQHH